MKHKVLITAPYFQLVVDEYRKVFEDNNIEIVVPLVNERMSEEELSLVIGDVDGILCGDDKITRKVLDAAPKLKTIVKWGTGTDSIDKEAAGKRGIPVRNTPNAFSIPVADSVMGYILCFARDIINLDRKMKDGVWMKKMTKALDECTLGIIGLGNVGKVVLQRARAFDMKVLTNDIKKKDYESMVSIEELLKKSDFVSINCDLNPTSQYLINKETLSLMKPTAYLINAARGPIVKEDDLVEALKDGVIAGAALDVFEDEPLP